MTEPTDFVYNVLVIHRSPSAGDDYLWLNRHQITADSGLVGDQGRLQAVANAFAEFHARVMFDSLFVDRVVIGTYGPDLPWPPGFASVPFNRQGTMSPNQWGEMLPLECALLVRRNVTRGRDGKFFLRGCLSRGVVDQFGNVAVNLKTLVYERGAALLSTLASQDVQMVMASGPVAAIQTRQVLNLDPVNFRTLQFRNRRKSAIRRYQLTDFLLGNLTGDALNQVWQLLNQLGLSQSPLLPPPPSDD